MDWIHRFNIQNPNQYNLSEPRILSKLPRKSLDDSLFDSLYANKEGMVHRRNPTKTSPQRSVGLA
jgi:hypothetical protein